MVKILFGMIVRERRRVAALAKTASSLDERVQLAEKVSAIREAALRSFMDEHRQEVADIEQKQQDHIISLMQMVREDSEQASRAKRSEEISGVVSEEQFQKKLVVLANERVLALEGHVSELRSKNAAMEEYVVKVDELNDLLSATTQECDWLEQIRNDLRTALRQIRDVASSHNGGPDDFSEDIGATIVAIADSFLHPSTGPSEKARQSTSERKASRIRKPQRADRVLLSPRLKKHIELMHSSDSESAADDDDEPYADMMADLALIAAGKVPPSLNSPEILAEASKLGESSVFDRLANPRSFTGTQKRAMSKRTGSDKTPEDSPPINKSNSAHSSQLSSSTETGNGLSQNADDGGDGVSPQNDKQSYESVFDRLGSPSHFTGTQKGKFHDTRAKRDRTAEEAADRVLSGILDNSDGRELSVVKFVRTEYVKQNVFDRLQKTTTHAAAIRQIETLQVDARITCDSNDHDSPTSRVATVLPSHQPETSRRTSPTGEAASSIQLDIGGESKADLDRASYAKRNVFDRLQKTTTLAAAVRQNETLHLEGRTSGETRTPVVSPSSAGAAGPLPKMDSKRSTATAPENPNIAKQNVFERLNKRTTHAYAKKSHKSKHAK